MAPVDAVALILTCVPTNAEMLDCVTMPESVTVLPNTEPASGNWHTPGFPDTPGNGGLSVPAPTNEDVLPEADALTVTDIPNVGLLMKPLIVTLVTVDWA